MSASNILALNKILRVWMNITIKLWHFVGSKIYISRDLTVMEKQHEDVDVVWFLIAWKPEYEPVRVQISGGSKIIYLPKVFSRI